MTALLLAEVVVLGFDTSRSMLTIFLKIYSIVISKIIYFSKNISAVTTSFVSSVYCIILFTKDWIIFWYWVFVIAVKLDSLMNVFTKGFWNNYAFYNLKNQAEISLIDINKIKNWKVFLCLTFSATVPTVTFFYFTDVPKEIKHKIWYWSVMCNK